MDISVTLLALRSGRALWQPAMRFLEVWSWFPLPPPTPSLVKRHPGWSLLAIAQAVVTLTGVCIVAILAASIPRAIAAENPVESPHSYLLPGSKGEELLQQCSRRRPQHVTGFFTPNAAQISELEARLGSYLIEARRSIEFQQYSRQYVGFIKDGKQYIYGNFFKGELEAAHAASVPVVVCDGGDNFWGIVYSLETRTFADIQFNGLA